MKRLFASVLFLFFGIHSFAQTNPEEDKVKEVVNTFFEGFHARDSTVMKSVFHTQPVIHTIGRTKDGETVLNHEELKNVLKGIVSIPLETNFKEVLHGYVIQVDGDMANAWTPYSFFVNDQFSHCGVNNFQLIRQGEQWKIIYLVDTRRREGCDQKQMK